MPATLNADLYPPHRVNKNKTAFQVQIGSLTLGENPAETPIATQPNPIKIIWSKTHNIKVHEIPYPSHRTIRTSRVTLWKMTMQLKTLRTEIFEKLLGMCSRGGPVYVKTGTSPSPLWMYITDFSFDQNMGYDDDYIEWNITFQEVYD